MKLGSHARLGEWSWRLSRLTWIVPCLSTHSHPNGTHSSCSCILFSCDIIKSCHLLTANLTLGAVQCSLIWYSHDTTHRKTQQWKVVTMLVNSKAGINQSLDSSFKNYSFIYFHCMCICVSSGKPEVTDSFSQHVELG